MLAYRRYPKDDDNFKSLFDTYKNRLYGYVLSVSHSPYIAEEIAQEIFIKLWLCRDLLSEIKNLDGYIYRIAHNTTLNYLRKAAYDIKLLHELQMRMNPETNNVEEHTATLEYNKILHEALTLLSPQRRLVFQLSRGQGLNRHEIASRLKLSQNTVKNHLVEALRFIRGHLDKYHNAVLLLLFLHLS